MRHYLFAAVLVALATPAASAQSPTVLVSRWYHRYLDRAPEPGGLAGWVDQIHQGEAPEWVLAQIIGGEEYYAKAGGTPRGFVHKALRDMTGRAPSADELRYWTSRVRGDDLPSVAFEMIQRFPQAVHAAPPRPAYREPYPQAPRYGPRPWDRLFRR